MKITSFFNFNKINNKSNKIDINPDEKKESDFKSLGLEKNKENLKIYKTLKDNNIEPTKDMIEEIKSSFDNLEGSLDEKINSLDMLLKKDIEINPKNIRLVHNYINKNMDYKSILSHLSKYFEDENIDYNKLFKELGLSKGFIKEFLKNFENEITLKENLKMILNNVDIKISSIDIEFINEILDTNENIENSKEVKNIEKSDNPIEFLDDFKANLDEIINEVKSEVEFDNIQCDIIKTNNFRQFLVGKTNEKMTEVRKEFDSFQKESVKILNNILDNNNLKDNENNLKKLIKNFEKVIMKSDITLYTSMGEEKELIEMTSKLELAKEYVSKGKLFESKEILKEIKKSLDKIDFKPKDTKVKAFMKKEANKILFNDKGKVKNIYDKISRPNKGVRDQLEVLRSIGINHESEAIQNIEKNNIKNIEMNNLKNMLLSITKSYGDKEVLAIEETVDKITGNQLLNKLEGKSSIQHMNLTIPYMQEDKIRSLDLYVNSKKENEKIDWKNSTLYFVIDLNKYGKTGIKISSTNKVININIKNDKPEFKTNTLDVFNSFLDELSDEGFLRGRVSFSKFNDDTKEAIDTVKTRGINLSKKGFDIRI